MNPHQQTTVFIRPKITAALENTLRFPLSVIEAPMGYGKTTAVREYAKTCSATVFWKAIIDNSLAAFWNSFVRIIDNIDKTCAEKLATLGFPADGVLLDEAIYLLGKLSLTEETLIVFDDYHIISSKHTDRFIETLIKAEIPRLHIVIISRAVFGENSTELFLKGHAFIMDKNYFMLSETEIIDYYRACGANITSSQAKKLFLYSEGWFSALYLCLLNFLQCGKFEEKIKLHNLVEKTVYQPCTPQTKDFLCVMCIFDSFTAEQAQFICGGSQAMAILQELLSDNAFLFYSVETGAYQIHSVVTGYLRKLFAEKPLEYKKAIWQKAGRWYLSSKEYSYAYDYFYKAGDFEGLLSAFEFEKLLATFEPEKDIENINKLILYFSSCPPEIKRSHPRACLLYAINLFTHNKPELYAQECLYISEILAGLPDGYHKGNLTKKQLAGELELLISFSKFNHICAMSEHHRRAYELLPSPSSFFSNSGSWTMDCPSVFYMFYRESGNAKKIVNDMLECMPYYYKITDGHGTGTEYVMQAEYFYNSGDFKNAELTSHTAYYAAQSKNQVSIMLCAFLLKLRLALLEGNSEAFSTLLSNTENDIKQMAMPSYIRTFDLCQGFLYATLELSNKVPDWIAGGDPRPNNLPFVCESFYNIIHGKILLNNKKYRQLLGGSPEFHAKAAIFSNLLAKIYFYIYQACAYDILGQTPEALKSLEMALDIAAPDRLVMPFVENCLHISHLLRKLSCKIAYRQINHCITTTAEIFDKGAMAVKNSLQNEANPLDMLTERERKIADLASLGLSNHEIGKQLFIAEITVKKILQNIYSKWGINNKIKLTKIILQNSK